MFLEWRRSEMKEWINQVAVKAEMPGIQMLQFAVTLN